MSIKSQQAKRFADNIRTKEVLSDALIAIQVKKVDEPHSFDEEELEGDIDALKEFLEGLEEYLKNRDTDFSELSPLANRLIKEEVGRSEAIEFVDDALSLLESEKWYEAENYIRRLQASSNSISEEQKQAI